jgi:hypothetical protein
MARAEYLLDARVLGAGRDAVEDLVGVLDELLDVRRVRGTRPRA